MSCVSITILLTASRVMIRSSITTTVIKCSTAQGWRVLLALISISQKAIDKIVSIAVSNHIHSSVHSPWRLSGTSSTGSSLFFRGECF